MVLEIDDAIVAKTTKCNADFKCLCEDQACLCPVIDSNSFSLVKINPKAKISCNYLFPFNKSSFCRCPTRNEIYKRYNK